MSHDSWTRLFEHPLWRLIAADMGASPANLLEDQQLLLDFLTACVRFHDTMADLTVALPEHGLTVGQAVDLLHGALIAERGALEKRDRPIDVDELASGRAKWVEPEAPQPLSREAKAVVRELWIRGMTPERIDQLLFDDAGRAVAAPFLERQPPHRKARQVFQAHQAGWTVYRMERELGVDGATATDILGQIGEKPNVSEVRRRAKSNAPVIVKLYEQGLTYKEIVDRLEPSDPDINLNKVRHALQRARRKGKIAGYRDQAKRHGRL